MANEDLLIILRHGERAWNNWLKRNPNRHIDLSEANLCGTDLSRLNLTQAELRKAKLNGANLSGANLRGANLIQADLSGTNLSGANISHANISRANLRGANLRNANLIQADLRLTNLIQTDLSRTNLNQTNLSQADLSGANLSEAILIKTNLERANLSACKIYGISAWGLKLIDTKQTDLLITPPEELPITVDNLEVAQFIYLLLHNEKIRDVIDTITSKVVLILGRFTDERMPVLEAIRKELRNRDYLPILFNFKGPENRDVKETVSTLAHMARFIIADITNARSISAELQSIVPQLPSVAVQPLIHSSDKEYGLFEHIKRYDWVLEPYRYESQEDLLSSIEEIIGPAVAKSNNIKTCNR
jgi:uncharacterized protein YjbI with pentapeptide repeats